MDFENQVFDIVFCELGFMFFLYRAAALKEIWRVLKPGGAFEDHGLGSLRALSRPGSDRLGLDKFVCAEQGADLNGMQSMSGPTILKSLLDAAGFKEIDVQARTGSMRWPSAEFLAGSYGAIGGISAEKPLRAAIIRDVESAMEAYVRPEGLIYPMEAVLARAVK